MRPIIALFVFVFLVSLASASADPVCKGNTDRYHFYVYKSSQLMYLCHGNALDSVMDWPVKVSTAKNSGAKRVEGDGKTPEGLWFLLRAYDTHSTNSMIRRNLGSSNLGQFGPCVIPINKRGNVAPFQGIFMHGTNEPKNLGRAVSHGCIRNYNFNIQEICNRFWSGDLKPGTPITIYASRVKDPAKAMK